MIREAQIIKWLQTLG